MEGPNPHHDYDYFIPALMDCWHYILGYILKPEDLNSLINTCTIFSDMLHYRMMSELIVPTMLKRVVLPKSTLLSLRVVNKGMKATTDAFLDKTEPPWLYNSCRFTAERPQQMEKFRNQFAARVLQGSFLSKYFNLQIPASGSRVEESVAFLRSLEHQISIISIELGFGADRTLPLPTVPELSRLLRELQGVTSLQLDVRGLDRVIAGDERQPIQFPRLPQLTDLQLLSFISRYDNRDRVLRSIKNLYELILQTYGSQLEKLTVSANTWDYLDLSDINFSNLGCLTIIFEFEADEETDYDIFQKLSMIKAPKVSCLNLGNGGATISTAFLTAIQSFRENLQELHLPRLVWSWSETDLWLQQANPLDWNCCPHVKKLVVDVEDLRTSIWLLFQVLFPNLEEIRFDSGNWTFYRYHRAPDVNMLKKLFGYFKRLKRLVWVLYFRPSKASEELVFTAI